LEALKLTHVSCFIPQISAENFIRRFGPGYRFPNLEKRWQAGPFGSRLSFLRLKGFGKNHDRQNYRQIGKLPNKAKRPEIQR
jgi:hypothetical protein